MVLGFFSGVEGPAGDSNERLAIVLAQSYLMPLLARANSLLLAFRSALFPVVDNGMKLECLHFWLHYDYFSNILS